MLRATIDEPTPLQVQVADGRTDLFARVRLYDPAGTELVGSPISLPHLADGLYGSIFTFTDEGYSTAVYNLYEDAGFAIGADYDYEAEVIEAVPDKFNIKKILGLSHSDTIEDSHAYDVAGNIVFIRVRSYDSGANATAAGVTSPAGGTIGLLFTWSITMEYTANRLTKYLVVEEP